MRGFLVLEKIGLFARQVFTIAWLMLLVPSLQSQPHHAFEGDPDSLEELLRHASGREQVDLLLDMSHAIWYDSFDESLNYATRSYNLARELDYREGMADALNRIGNIDYLLGNYESVVDTYLQAVEIAVALGDYRRLGIYLNETGVLYLELTRYDSAEVYLLKALIAKEEHGDTEMIVETLNNLGILYRDIGQYSLSMEYLNRQLDILEQSGSIGRLPLIHMQIGEVFHFQEQYNGSLKHFLKSLKYAEETADTQSIAMSYHHIARSWLAKGSYDNALANINKSLDLAKALSLQPMLKDNYSLLFQYYKETGGYEAALDYLTIYSRMKDSIRKQNLITRYNQLERVFDIKQQNRRIELQQKENEIQQLQMGRHDDLRVLLLAMLLILVTLKIIIIYRFTIIHQTNRILKKKNYELEKITDKLRLSTLSLEQLNATKNRFFSIIAHDLKNPFNALLGFSEIITTSFNQLREHEIREYVSIVHQSSQNLYKLLENLLKWSAAQTGTMRFFPEKFDLVSLINSEIIFLRINAAKKQINIVNKMPDELIINSDKLLLSSVVRNLTDNAIKFTRQGGSIGISIRNEAEEITVEIDDSGIGIPEEMQKKLFKIDGDISRKGTNKEEGGGLGLILCKELVEKAGGNIGVESTVGKGSRFWFTLPHKADG